MVVPGPVSSLTGEETEPRGEKGLGQDGPVGWWPRTQVLPPCSEPRGLPSTLWCGPTGWGNKSPLRDAARRPGNDHLRDPTRSPGSSVLSKRTVLVPMGEPRTTPRFSGLSTQPHGREDLGMEGSKVQLWVDSTSGQSGPLATKVQCSAGDAQREG